MYIQTHTEKLKLLFHLIDCCYISMECNRDEAVRAREMAEHKFSSQDYASAKKLAQKAQALFPDLENITQFLAVINVHEASQRKILETNDKDWYAILQVSPDADDETVKKQYRKLALLLHPDKNKSVGAESAFKLIVEALQTLSDMSKRKVFDMKLRNYMSSHVSTHSKTSSDFGKQSTERSHCQYPYPNVFFNRANERQFCQKQSQSSSSARQSLLHPFAFWTVCLSCKSRYQYLRRFENQNLLCPQCKQKFVARDLSEKFAQVSGQTKSQRVSVKPRPSVFRYSCNAADKDEILKRFGHYQKLAAMAKDGGDENQKDEDGIFREFDLHQKASGMVMIDHNDKQKTRMKTSGYEILREKHVCEIPLNDDNNHCHPQEEMHESEAKMEKEMLSVREQEKKSMAIEKIQIQEASAKTNMKEQVKDCVKMKKKQDKKRKASRIDSKEDWKKFNSVEAECDDHKKAHLRRSSRTKRYVNYNNSVDSNTDDDFQSLPSVKKMKVRKAEIGIGPTKTSNGLEMTKKLDKLSKNATRKKHRLQPGGFKVRLQDDIDNVEDARDYMFIPDLK